MAVEVHLVLPSSVPLCSAVGTRVPVMAAVHTLEATGRVRGTEVGTVCCMVCCTCRCVAVWVR